jgi:hypothetical protein
MKYDVSATGKEINGQLEMTFNSGEYAGVTWTYGGLKFADKENEDGSMNMSFDYEITGDIRAKNIEKFQNTIGDVLLDILEEQIKHEQVVFKGGSDENVIAE